MVLSLIAFAFSIFTYRRSRRERFYADIDSMYLGILKIGIDHPEFVNPKNTTDYMKRFKDENELLRYETYAYIVWNLCETIYDRRDDDLFNTWRTVIVAENKLHRKWLDDPENHHKFKGEFLKYVQHEFPL